MRYPISYNPKDSTINYYLGKDVTFLNGWFMGYYTIYSYAKTKKAIDKGLLVFYRKFYI